MLNYDLDLFKLSFEITHWFILLTSFLNGLSYQSSLLSYPFFVFACRVSAFYDCSRGIYKEIDNLAGLSDFLIFPRICALNSAHNNLSYKLNIGDQQLPRRGMLSAVFNKMI